MTYIEELKEVIERLHGSRATHVETVPIKEEFQGQTVWEGEVEVFDLHDHLNTHRVLRGRMKRKTRTIHDAM